MTQGSSQLSAILNVDLGVDAVQTLQTLLGIKVFPVIFVRTIEQPTVFLQAIFLVPCAVHTWDNIASFAGNENTTIFLKTSISQLNYYFSVWFLL